MKTLQDESEEQRPTTRSAQTPAPLHGKALVAWRVVWSLFVLFDLGILVFSIPRFIAQQRTVCTDLTRVNCGLYQLGPAQMVVLNRFGFSLVGYAAYVLMLDAVITLALLLIGALIFWHKSNDRMGLFVSLLLITFACLGVDEVHMNVINDAVLPLPLLIFGYLVLFLQWPALGFFFYLFPDGRFVPRWSWLLGFLFVVQVGFYLAPYPYDLPHWPQATQFLDLLVVYGSAVGTQMYRYFAVATPLQRQQIKWLTFGFGATLLITLIGGVVPAIFSDLNAPSSWYQLGSILSSPLDLFCAYIFIPISIGVALLRYQLWDIDRVINRALVYALLTGILLALYIGLIFGGQALLAGVIGKGNGVMLVVSTLLIAALFQPLRRRIQTIIDRRFYRYKYDAARTVAAFSTTLRNEVDLDQLREELLAVVQETMQPASLSLWIRPLKQQAPGERIGGESLSGGGERPNADHADAP